MNAKHLAIQLMAMGVTPQSLIEPALHEDGMLVISDTVHVQVPLDSMEPNVVRETRAGHFVFGVNRSNMELLVADIQEALHAAAKETPPLGRSKP